MDITLKQASDLAQLNISSCRFYKDKYIQYFTTSGEGKTMKYEKDSTVELLILIRESYKKGLDQDQITQILDEKYGVNVTDLIPQEKENEITITPQELINEIKETFSTEIKRLENKIDELTEIIRQQQRNNKKWWEFWK
jgi:hypothetical protein